MELTATAMPSDERRLKRTLALLGGFVGIGYLYVGRIGYAVALLVATDVVVFGAAWARWIFVPAGWYAYIFCTVLLLLVPIVHPLVIAWSRPIVPPKSYNRWWWYVVWAVGVWLLSAFVGPHPDNRAALIGYDIFRNPSSAMSPTLESGDFVVVDAWRYRDAAPEFGDVAVYRLDDGITYVKRIVGLPGDTVEVQGRLLVRNGSVVDERYLRAPEPGFRMRDFPPVTLGADEFFVLGDHRDNSMDSRQTGPVGRDQIVGRVEFIAFSYADAGVRWERFPVLLADD